MSEPILPDSNWELAIIADKVIAKRRELAAGGYNIGIPKVSQA
jgi:hypothetical protein